MSPAESGSQRRRRFLCAAAWLSLARGTVALLAVALPGCGGRLSDVADLSGLSTSAGALLPSFSPQTFDYVVAVPNATDSITITAVAADDGASIRVNGAKVKSGSASPAQSLAVGSNTVLVVVTSEDDQVTRTTTVAVVRGAAPPSSDASLSALLVSGGSLSPTFAPATTAYTVSIANAVTSVTVTPISGQSPSSITVNGVAVADATPSVPLNLAVGATLVTVVVVSQDRSTTRNYLITLTRAAA